MQPVRETRVRPDERLKSLEIALDEERMKEVFAPKAKARFGDRFEIRSIDIAVYRRHVNRCVVRYRIAGSNGDHAGEAQWGVIGKVLDAGAGERVHENMRRLWTHGFSRDAADRVSMAEPLEYLPALSMMLQEEVGGASVRNLLKQTREERHFRLAARAVAKLHRCPVWAGTARTVQDHLQRCHPRYPFLALACPHLAGPIERIVEGALRIEERLSDVRFTPVHGDFHLGQVHVDGDRAWLVDLDAFGYADPASDLGNLIVFLKDKARRDAAVGALIAAFLDEYFSVMDRRIMDRIPLFEALTHLRRACKSLRLQDAEWQQRIERMIGAGIASIEEMEQRFPCGNGRHP